MGHEDDNPATVLLKRIETGDASAAEELLPIIYGELHQVAQRFMSRENPGHTLQPTALVHEAWMKLVGQTRHQWNGRTHFLAVAAHAMRAILVDHARSRRALKRGGRRDRVVLEEAVAFYEQRAVDLLDLDTAMSRLAGIDQQLAQVVELRFFGGLTNDEVGKVIGVSTPTVERRWRVARAWLQKALEDNAEVAPDPEAEPPGDAARDDDRARG